MPSSIVTESHSSYYNEFENEQMRAAADFASFVNMGEEGSNAIKKIIDNSGSQLAEELKNYEFPKEGSPGQKAKGFIDYLKAKQKPGDGDGDGEPGDDEDENPPNKKKPGGPLTTGGETMEEITGFNQKEMSDPDSPIGKLMEMMKSLDQFKGLGETEKELIEDPEGDIEKLYVVDDVEHIPSVELREFLNPFWIEKYVEGDMYYPKKYKYDEKKKDILLLIDRSGSMFDEKVQTWVRAALLFVLNKCLENKTEAYIATFENKMDTVRHVYDAASAKAVWESYHCQGGGDTQVGKILESIGTEYAAGKLREFTLANNPQILIVNDGADYVKTGTIVPTTYALALGANNEGLRSLCYNSGGQYLLIDSEAMKSGDLSMVDGRGNLIGSDAINKSHDDDDDDEWGENDDEDYW